MPLEHVIAYMVKGGEEALGNFVKATKKWLIAYFAFTVIQIVLDLTQFFIQVKNFGSLNSSAFQGLALVTIASIFLYLNWYYLFWILSLQFKFPHYVSATFIRALMGLLENIHHAIGQAMFKS